MPLKLNINRTAKVTVPVPVTGPSGDTVIESFVAECKILKRSDTQKESPLLDEILVGVEGLELVNEHGHLLQGDELLTAVKNDTDLAGLIVQAWRLGNEQTLTKSKTWFEQHKS